MGPHPPPPLYPQLSTDRCITQGRRATASDVVCQPPLGASFRTRPRALTESSCLRSSATASATVFPDAVVEAEVEPHICVAEAALPRFAETALLRFAEIALLRFAETSLLLLDRS
jgi:hypothetical protein